jgi:1,2-phenylacetyl-CoA epoxidase catalytic subunit
MSREAAIEKLIATYKKMMEDDAMYRAAIARHWGITKETNNVLE